MRRASIVWIALSVACSSGSGPADDDGTDLVDLGTDGPTDVDTDTGVPVEDTGTAVTSLAPLEGRPALIVLHGCGQSAADLSARADLDRIADAFDAVVVVPTVPNGGVYLGCWDYYGASHSRTSPHPSFLLDLVDELLADPALDVDPGRVWIAGLSSGAGMAMVMGCLAPDVFSGVGIAAGPTVGTTAFEAATVGTDVAQGRADCVALAGPHAADFANQSVGTVAGTGDIFVAQGYATLNAEVFASIYATGGAELTAAPLDVGSLPGYEPVGTGTVHSDAGGPRVVSISAQGMGHAWPAGTGPGAEIGFVASQGVDFAWTLADLFTEHARRR
jgi:poly(3-hydroxybutyrate) depolymerase